VTDRTSKLWEANLALTQREEDLRLSREETVTRLALAAEAHDDETARHVERMSRITGRLHGKVTGDPEGADLVRVATVLHDVGKLGIPDSILRKPGRLTEEERDVIRGHAEIGNRILAGSESKLLQLAAVIALTHHERNDGTGYPGGLKGDEIPMEAKLAAIADTFDALTSNRVYRKAFEVRDALSIMRGRRASHFDADLLDLFFESIDEVIGPLGPEALAHRLASAGSHRR
jgi:cyclic di-GMP phosphodiesterase